MKNNFILLLAFVLMTVCVQAQYKNVPVFTKTVGTANELQKALVGAQDGDVIGIKPGKYNVAKLELSFANKHNVVLRSVSGNPDDVILTGNGFHKLGSSVNLLKITKNSNYITIYGITFRDASEHGIKVEGESSVGYITIDNCKFFNINERMIKGSKHRSPRVPGMIITNCHFENDLDCIPTEADKPGWGSAYIGGIDMMVLDNAVISDNTFVNIRGANGGGRGAIFIWVGSSNIIVERNTIINCDRGICFGNPMAPDGQLGPNYYHYVNGGIIRNNMIVSSQKQPIELAWVRNVKVYNNTIYRNDGGVGIQDTGAEHSQNVVIENNILRSATLVNLQEAAIGKHNLVSNDIPSSYFVNPEAGNLRLTSEAVKAISRGIILDHVEDDIDNKLRSKVVFDIGAHAYGTLPGTAFKGKKDTPGFTKTVGTENELQNALVNAQDGDVIGIKPGKYNVAKLNLTIVDKHNIVLRSVSGNPDDVILAGSGFHKLGSDVELLKITKKSSYITIDGITFRDASVHGIKVAGEDNVGYVTINNCKFFNVNERMIKGSQHGSTRVPGMVITNCHFENDLDCIPTEDDKPGWGSAYIGGIDMMVLDNAVISGNTFVNIRGANGGGRGAIFIWQGSTNIIAERNTIINCDRGICFGNPMYPDGRLSSDYFFHINGGIIRNNMIVSSQKQPIELAWVKNVKVYNNTIYRNDGGVGIQDASAEFSLNVVIENNLLRSATLENLQNATIGKHNLVGNDIPSSYFVNPEAGNLRLTPEAVKAIGRGAILDIVDDDIDNRVRSKTIFDIGAQAYGLVP